MVKYNLILVGLSFLAFSNSSFSMQFTSTINKLKLPLLMSVEQPPAIKFVNPGEMKVTARRMCGDGDVAHFHEQFPAFEFVPSTQPKLDVIVGYWIVEKGSTNISPTEDNWYPMAYSRVNIEPTTSNSGGVFQYFNDPNKDTTGTDAFSEELVKLFKVSSKSFETNKKEYQVYSSVISCINPDHGQFMVEKGKGTPTPSPLDIITSLDDMDAPSFKESTTHIKVVQSNTRYKFTFGEEGKELKGRLFKTFKDIMAIQHPKDVDDYKQQTTKLGLDDIIKGNKFDFCKDMGAKIDQSKKIYKYELFPMNLTCKKLFDGNVLAEVYNKFMKPSEFPDLGQFEILKKNLAKRFLIAAGLEAAQEQLDEEAVIIRTGCVPTAVQKPIDRIVSSYPLKFILKGTKYEIIPNEFNHIHPESLFAIRDYKDYYSNPILAIWGQVLADKNVPISPSSLKLKLEETVDNPFLNLDTVKLNINFKVRSVGGSCNGTIYC
jgi:hypothetical protein